MLTFTRRTMLRRSAQAAAAAAFGATLGPLMAAPQSRGFKIGTLDFMVGKRSDPAAFDIARKIGLDGVQIDPGAPADDMHVFKPEVQKVYREAAARTGLEIPSLAIGALLQVPLATDPRAAEWVGRSIGAAKALGARVVLVPFFDKGELDMNKPAEIEHVVQVLRRLGPEAQKQGVVLGLENYLSADDNRKIIDRIGSPAVQVYYDVGNSTDKHRDVLREIRSLGKLICEFHAKDGRFLLGQGRIDFKKVRQAMDDIGYSGWIQIEAANPHGMLVDLPANLKYLRGIFPRQAK